MYKNKTRVFYGALSILLMMSSVFAIEAEFKNSLMKVELIKTSEASYNIDLYTKNDFLEPVKVIKKSDLNYYILLPETKNESGRNHIVGTDIRDISTNVYPYAGSDVNNGYVKININTTKPINFKINVMNNNSTKIDKKAPLVALAPKKQLKEQSVVEKKNFDSPYNEEIKTRKKTVKMSSGDTSSNVATASKIKIEDAIKEEIERFRTERREKYLAEEFPDLNIEDYSYNSEENFKEDISGVESEFTDLQEISLKSKIAKKLKESGLKKTDFLWMCIAIFMGLVGLIFLFARKKPQVRLKTKAELMQGGCVTGFKKQQNEEKPQKNNGQYFVFDNNIKQTGFCDPATSAIKRNYELSTYDPDLKNKYDRNKPVKKSSHGEYDIIQKILKEDTFMDIPAESLANCMKDSSQAMLRNKRNETNTVFNQQEKTSEPIKQVEVAPKAPISDPVILSSVEITPSHGFMCVSYNDNIALMGYIFDDVFALYNFKVPKLENYEIKYRLTDKDDKSARFIVKIAGEKMLVNVTKTHMNLEVLL